MRNRAVRKAATSVSHVCSVTLKVAATLFILVVGLVVLLRYFGIPVPTAEQVLQDASRIL
jgi:hypothetical protein